MHHPKSKGVVIAVVINAFITILGLFFRVSGKVSEIETAREHATEGVPMIMNWLIAHLDLIGGSAALCSLAGLLLLERKSKTEKAEQEKARLDASKGPLFTHRDAKIIARDGKDWINITLVNDGDETAVNVVVVPVFWNRDFRENPSIKPSPDSHPVPMGGKRTLWAELIQYSRETPFIFAVIVFSRGQVSGYHRASPIHLSWPGAFLKGTDLSLNNASTGEAMLFGNKLAEYLGVKGEITVESQEGIFTKFVDDVHTVEMQNLLAYPGSEIPRIADSGASEKLGALQYQDVAEYSVDGHKSALWNGAVPMRPTALDFWCKSFVLRKKGIITWKCDTSTDKLCRDALARVPQFPFARFFLAVRLKQDGDPSWKTEANEVLAIFQRTASLPYHHADHDYFLNETQKLLHE